MQTLLPPNATQLELDLEQVQTGATALPVEILKLYQAQNCPSGMLPWLAWHVSVDEWESRWSEQTRRDVIAESVRLHQKKGTAWAVKRILGLTGLPDTTLFEWWQPYETYDLLPDLPVHTFHLRVWSTPDSNPVVITHEEYDSIRLLVDWSKPARSHYHFDIGVRIKENIEAGCGAGMAAQTERTAIAEYTPNTQAQNTAHVGAGASMAAQTERTAIAEYTPNAQAQNTAHVGVGASIAAQTECTAITEYMPNALSKVNAYVAQGASMATQFAKSCLMQRNCEVAVQAQSSLSMAGAGCLRLHLAFVL